MSFERYTQIYDGGEQGRTIRPHGNSAEFSFSLDKKENARYRLFTVGETEQFYFWKDEPDGPYLYRMITDALDTAHAIKDRYCLDLSCKRPETYLKRVYKKVAWPPKISYLAMKSLPTAWRFGVTVSAKDLTFAKDGFLQMRVDVRLQKEGVHPRSVAGAPDFSYVISFPMGTYEGEALFREIEIPLNTAHVGVFIEGKGYRGNCYVEQPHLSAGGQNLLPAFTESVADKEGLDWVGQYLSRKEWPEFRVRLNGKAVFTGEIFERSHRGSEWSIDLPAELLCHENRITYELISDYHDPLPYTFYEVGIIEQPNEALSIIAVSEAAPAGGKARVLLRTARPNTRVTLTCHSEQLSGKSEYLFREAGLHGILLSCGEPCNDASFTLSGEAFAAEGCVKRIVCRAKDNVITGTGDMIYVHQDERSMEEYLSWYLSNGVGDLITVRPTYRWAGTRTLNALLWRRFRRLMGELDLKYVLMADGREIPGLSTQPQSDLLGGKGFLGVQLHERDGAQYYWGLRLRTTKTEEMYYDLEAFAFDEDPDHTSSHHSANAHFETDEGRVVLADRQMPADYRLAHEKSIKSLMRYRRPWDTRHTGPACLFGAMAEAGYTWLGAETMYSTMEPLLGFLRGVARDRKMPTFGVHHAVQWSSTPHESPARYRRYRLALYASYMQGATDINTEEGLWHLEEYYESHNRFGKACTAHLKQQQDFYRYVSTHSRTGRFLSPFALLHGRDDGVHFFGKNCIWGVRRPQSAAEDGWDLLTAFYPKSLPGKSIYRHACPEDLPQGYHSGTPYGNLDIIPANGKASTWSAHRALAFLGYNRLAEGDAEQMLSYVRKGGKLLLTRAHLTVTTDMDAVRDGKLEFTENVMNFANGMPIFAQSTVNGAPVAVCTNAKKPDRVLALADDGQPLVCAYRVGRGEVILFNTKAYPADPAIRALYESELTALAEATNAAEPAWVTCGDDVEFAVYEQKDGTRHVYFLAVDWYRDPATLRHATLRLGTDCYDVALPFGVMLKCVTDGKAAVWAESEEGEVLALAGDTATVQGTGKVTFRVAKEGQLRAVTLDLAKAPVQTFKI